MDIKWRFVDIVDYPFYMLLSIDLKRAIFWMDHHNVWHYAELDNNVSHDFNEVWFDEV